MTAIKYRTTGVDGFNIFYREAGAAGAPKLLLLHGFPSAGHMFRDLIPLLTKETLSALLSVTAAPSPSGRGLG
jgi:pimeloyl-ACP methyl ester carboxylesterase